MIYYFFLNRLIDCSSRGLPQNTGRGEGGTRSYRRKPITRDVQCIARSVARRKTRIFRFKPAIVILNSRFTRAGY